MKKYNCQVAKSAIAFIGNNAYLCCLTKHKGGGMIKLIENYENKEIDWEEVFRKKQTIISQMHSGIIPAQCEGCFYINEYKEEEHQEAQEIQNCNEQNEKIETEEKTEEISNEIEDKKEEKENYQFECFNIAPFVPCQCKCRYCCIYKDTSQKDIKFAPIIKGMREHNLIKQYEHTFMSISGGEPTLIKDFEELLYESANSGIAKFDISTTGVKFSQAIADMLTREDKYINVTVSIDSGNRELYKEIKNVDLFDNVISNLKRYIEYENEDKTQVRTKYIIIPNVNDREEDILEWYELSKSIGIKSIVLDVEREYYLREGDIPERYLAMIELIKSKAKEDDIVVGYYESLQNHMGKIEANREKAQE
jgi:pyruvate-formate lyase-activating enzyme